jgi:hypothetical protein
VLKRFCRAFLFVTGLAAWGCAMPSPQAFDTLTSSVLNTGLFIQLAAINAQWPNLKLWVNQFFNNAI